VATITLTSPANRNAMSLHVRQGLSEALTRTAQDPAIRVLVLTNEGPVFCAGADLKESEADRSAGPSGRSILQQVMTFPKPTVAAARGSARAGGIGLLAACDLAIGVEDATFAFSEVRLGVVPAVIAVPCLPRMSPRAASRYLLTGDTFSAAQAVAMGLITEAVPGGELDAVVGRRVESLLLGAPAAIAQTRRLVASVTSGGADLEERFRCAEALSNSFFASEDAAEGRRAFAERRPPCWATPELGGPGLEGAR
jgi:enoyl-CoA hydratase/carnithine racemase